MNGPRKDGSTDRLVLSSILSDVRHRRILSIIANQSTPLTERDLAVQLAAQEAEKPPSLVSESECQKRLLLLHHQKLPKLASAGLIKRTPAGIRLVPWFPVNLDSFGVPVPPSSDPEDAGWDLIAVIMARPYRQQLLSIVAAEDGPVSLEELAERLIGHDEVRLDPAGRDHDRFEARLHHIDLPKLETLGVLEYDHESKTVTPSRSLTPAR